tara:strand:- start:890 stop:1105 length:216 start_codon:yes stop_codon:yes gene_type:complete
LGDDINLQDQMVMIGLCDEGECVWHYFGPETVGIFYKKCSQAGFFLEYIKDNCFNYMFYMNKKILARYLLN